MLERLFTKINYMSIRKHIDKEMKMMINAFAVITAFDGVKSLEIIGSDKKIKAYIEKKFSHLSLRVQRLLIEYAHDEYLHLLRVYKNDKKKHILNKVFILREVKKNISLERQLLEIIDIDNERGEDELSFIEELNLIHSKNENDSELYSGMKKGLSMPEILIALLIMTVVTSLGYTEYRTSQWYSSVNESLQKFDGFLNNYVMNVKTGYINATGDNCSTSYNYNNITASRIVECAKINSFYPYEGTLSTNPTESYITKIFLNEYSDDGKGCKIYFDDISSIEYYVFFDCSNINYDDNSPRHKAFIEEKISAFLREYYSSIFIGEEREAVSIESSNGGASNDGLIRLRMKK